jgi:hypothetical protein
MSLAQAIQDAVSVKNKIHSNNPDFLIVIPEI